MYNNNDSYAAEFMASINNPQPAQTPAAAPTDTTGRKKKILIILVALLVVLFAVAIIVALFGSNNSRFKAVHTGVSITVVPVRATVEIDGKNYQNGTYALEPGKYSAKISAEGFEPKTIDFEVSTIKLTPLMGYLLPTSGSYDENDYDLLRFLSDSEATDAFVESFMLGKDVDYAFPSAQNGLLRLDDVPLGDDFTTYSKKIISETVSAYFYFAHPDIKKIASIENKNDGKTIDIVIDEEQKYSVYYSVGKNNDDDDDDDIQNKSISFVSIQKYGNDEVLFQSNGSFIYDRSNLNLGTDDTGSTNFE